MSAIIKLMADTQRTAGSWINPAMLALSTHGWSTEVKNRLLRQRSRGDESLHVDAVLLLQSLDESLDEIRKVQYDMLVWCNAGAFPINIPDVAAQPTCADAMDEAIGLLNVFDIHLARCKSKTDDCVLFDVHLGFLTDVMAILHPHVNDSKFMDDLDLGSYLHFLQSALCTCSAHSSTTMCSCSYSYTNSY